jgi:RimJ/RimL family protein N-acetyltransferase
VSERRTARLRLRRVTHGDVASVVSLSTDPRTHRHSPTGTPTREEAEAFARRFVEDWDTYGLGYWIVEHEGHDVGVAGVKPARIGERPCWNMYYRFTPAVTGADSPPRPRARRSPPRGSTRRTGRWW